MKIAYNGRFFSTPKMTGVERVAYNLLKHLVKIDNENEYIIFAGKKEYLTGIVTYSNVFCIECNLLLGNRIQRHFWEQVHLPVLLKKHNCDILFNPTNTAPVLSGKRSVLFLCDTSFLVNPKWFSKSFQYVYRTLTPIIAKRSKKIITISENSKKDIIHYLNIEDSKIRVIYPAIEDNLFVNDKCNNREVLKSLRVAKPFILFTGSLEPRKNLFNLIKSFLKLKQNDKIKHKLIIVGTKNPNFPALDFEKNKYKYIERDVFFLDYVEDSQLLSLYQGADLLVYPSLYEGFGLPPLEAMACGCPVVVSNVASLPEVCGDAVCYVNPGSVDSIAEGIYRVLTDEDLRKFLIQKGLERVKMFSWEKAARETLKVFEEVLRA